MTNPKRYIVEPVVKAGFNLRPGFKAAYNGLKGKSPEQAAKVVNSIFTETLNATKNTVSNFNKDLKRSINATTMEAFNILQEAYRQGRISLNTFLKETENLSKGVVPTTGVIATLMAGNQQAKSETTNQETNSKANSIKQLTPEEEAKLKAKGRQDLISTSKSPLKQQLNYVSSDDVIKATRDYNSSPERVVDDLIELVLIAATSGKVSSGIAVKGRQALMQAARKYGVEKQIVQFTKQLPAVINKGSTAITKFINNSVANTRNTLVKANPTAMKSINEKKAQMTSEMEKAFNEVFGATKQVDRTRPGDVFSYFFENYVGKSGAKKATEKFANSQKLNQSEEASFVKLIKENSDELGKLAKEVGIKSKAEIPNFIKFIKQLGSIIENSPAYIKGLATAGGLAGNIVNSGLSLFDMYQAFKEGGDNLIPRTIADLSRMGASAIPGGFLPKLLYGSLGYGVGDKLSMAALKKLGVQSGYTPEQEQEIINGYRQPGLDTQYNEYEVGGSGRKYHVKGDRVYAFDTGLPVSLREFNEDINAGARFKYEQALDTYNNVNGEYQQLLAAKQQGYNIPDNQIEIAAVNTQNAYNQLGIASQEVQRVQKATENDYDINGDLVQQYTDRYVTPQKALEEQRRIEAQQDYNERYQKLFNQIAQANYDNINRYYSNPQNIQEEYFEYINRMTGMGYRPMSPEQFIEVQKNKAMYNIAPEIHKQATQILEQGIIQQSNLGNIGQKYYKTASDVEHNIVTEGQTDVKNKETQRHNIMQEQIGVGNLGVNQANAETRAKAAEIQNQIAGLKQQQLELEQQLAPYKKLNALSGAAQSTGPMSGMTMDQLINIDPELGKQVFPAAFQPSVNQLQQPVQQKQPNIIDQGVQGIQSFWNNLTGQ